METRIKERREGMKQRNKEGTGGKEPCLWLEPQLKLEENFLAVIGVFPEIGEDDIAVERDQRS